MIQDLQRQGLQNPLRVRRLIEQAIALTQLDLGGLTVFTETGSRNCVVTPIIAARAGARQVFAITRDSSYGTAQVIEAHTRQCAEFCGVADRLQVVRTKRAEEIAQADIVTNLGFVRPIDRSMIELMKPASVIPLMYEAWEFRPGDVDLEACRDKGIAVAGINEEFPGLDLFRYAGPICIRMLLEAGIEVYRSRIIVVSGDKFGDHICASLSNAGAEVERVTDLAGGGAGVPWCGADALVIADYQGETVFIGAGGQMSADRLREAAPGLSVILFAGMVDTEALAAAGIPYYPAQAIPQPRRMYQLFADLGPKPHIELMTAGLKVGQLLLDARRGAAASPLRSLVQPMAS